MLITVDHERMLVAVREILESKRVADPSWITCQDLDALARNIAQAVCLVDHGAWTRIPCGHCGAEDSRAASHLPCWKCGLFPALQRKMAIAPERPSFDDLLGRDGKAWP